MAELTVVQRRLVNNFAILIMAGRRTMEDVPEELKVEVELRIAEIEVEKLT